DLQTVKTQTVTCGQAVTVGAFVGNATHALVVDGSGYVTVAANNDKTGYSLTQGFPANFASLGITSAGKVSGVVLVDTLTTYTGDTPQTGDAYARIGAAGAGLTALGDTRIAHLDADVTTRAPASTALSTTQWTTARAGYLDNLNVGGAVASHADAAAIDA